MTYFKARPKNFAEPEHLTERCPHKEENQKMKIRAHSVSFLLVWATCSAAAAEVGVSSGSPQGAAAFESALSWEQLAAEFLINAIPSDGSPAAKAAQKTASLPKVNVSLSGTIRNTQGIDICGLVLANGQFVFSCAPNGVYSLTPPLDAANQLTLFGFADGHFPFRTTLGGGGRYDILLNVASSGGGTVPNSNITFTITDGCRDGWAINYKFYDETNNLVWPSANTHYATQFDDTPYSHNLSCRTGALVCYGARNANPLGGYWGVDVDNSRSCPDCCIRCENGNRLSRILVC